MLIVFIAIPPESIGRLRGASSLLARDRHHLVVDASGLTTPPICVAGANGQLRSAARGADALTCALASVRCFLRH
jgi:hypothetical protein